MSPRVLPSRGFLTRNDHRQKLTAHFFTLAVLLSMAFTANRFLTPDTFWAPWVVVPLVLAFVVHLIRFARGTLGTMGGARRGAPGRDH